jgi:hypothetical protein
MKSPRLFLVTLLLAATGCNRTHTVGSVDDSFPIVQLTYAHRIEEVRLWADYGYVIDWPGDKTPRFYVFDRSRRDRSRQATWEAFVAALRAIPDGSELDTVSRCTVPFDWGMPEGRRQELGRLFAEKSFNLVSRDDADRHCAFCYCETTRMIVLSDAKR